MIKMVFCLKKRADISTEFFYDYWLNQHGPLVRTHRHALGIEKYIQRHSDLFEWEQLAIESRGMTESYSGFAELWWKDIDTLSQALTSEECIAAAAILVEDEAKFIDLSQSTIAFTREHVIVD